MEHIDVAVIGAGVTGLASARAIAQAGRSVCVLERHPRPGMDTSTHNSGVIHAGLYYPAGTLKARLCVEGRERMYEFSARYNVAHVRSGKLVVAHDETEVHELEALKKRGEGNGVAGLAIVDRAFIVAREPAVSAEVALWSPDSGIVNAEEYVKALLGTGADAGVIFLPGTKVVGADRRGDGMVLTTERETILATVVVNAAGLYADEVSRLLGGEAFTIYPCRGEYAEFTPAKRSLVRALVYPLPHASGHGLGVHLVRTTGGQVWLGPTVRYQDRKDDYENDREPLESFAAAARRLIDGVTVDDLRLSGSGIRAKLHPPSESFADFLIRRDRENPFVVQASGIDSPGLTSSLAIGDLVADLVEESLR
ncbi:MAG: NAD(P)/FAD-dependent oxidoreductase [Acidobacteria bacterium]|nr:MAG: NAD(P)/FAD-dependent oxidoreductase [Acidobacteriota bacterium]